jgi:hypothetical protein
MRFEASVFFDHTTFIDISYMYISNSNSPFPSHCCHHVYQVRKRRLYACHAINIVVLLDLLWFLLSGRVPVWFFTLFCSLCPLWLWYFKN